MSESMTNREKIISEALETIKRYHEDNTRLRGLLRRCESFLLWFIEMEDIETDHIEGLDILMDELAKELADELAQAQADEYRESEAMHYKLEDFEDE